MIERFDLVPASVRQPNGVIGLLRIDRPDRKQPRRLGKKVPVDECEGQADEAICSSCRRWALATFSQVSKLSKVRSQKEAEKKLGHTVGHTRLIQKLQLIENQHGARCRVRTCDPIRVKDVLYH